MIDVKVDTDKLTIYLEKITPMIMTAIRGEIDVQASLLTDHIRLTKLSGPSTSSSVARRTGTLARSLKSIRSSVSDNKVSGGIQVGSGIPYAGIHIKSGLGSTTIQSKGKLLAIPVGPALTKGGNVRKPGPRAYPGLFPITSKSGNKLLVMKGTTGKGKNKTGTLIPYFILKNSVTIPARVDPQEVLNSRVGNIIEGLKRAIAIAGGAHP
jgi:hypothetical protein